MRMVMDETTVPCFTKPNGDSAPNGPRYTPAYPAKLAWRSFTAKSCQVGDRHARESGHPVLPGSRAPAATGFRLSLATLARPE